MGWVGKGELRVIDTREVQGTGGLHLAHGEAEGPRVGGNVVDCTIGEIGAMHFGDDVMVIHVRHVFEKGGTVDVKRCSVKAVFLDVVGIIGITGHEVEGLDWVIEIAQVNVSIGVGGELVLCLGDEKFVFIVREVLTLICIEVDVVTEHLGGHIGCKSITALDTNFNIVILECDEGERLGPVFPKEEGDHVVVPRVILFPGVGGDSEGSLSRRVPHEGVMNTLNVKGVKCGDQLTTDPKLEFCGAGSGL